jgi:hypothetical protein
MTKKNKNLERKEGKIRVSMKTPCSVSELESLLHMVSQAGHWHNAEVKGEEGVIVVEFETEPSLDNY